MAEDPKHFETEHNDDGRPTDKRSCTDFICLIVFCFFMGAMGYVSSYAFKNGEPKRLTHGFDYNGSLCGVDANVKDQPYLYWCPSGGYTVPGVPMALNYKAPVCVKKCPDGVNDTAIDCSSATGSSGGGLGSALAAAGVTSNMPYPTETILGMYCLPELNKIATLASAANVQVPTGLRSKLTSSSGPLNNQQEKFSKEIGSFRRCQYLMIGSLFFAMLMGCVWMCIIRMCAKPMVYCSIALVLLLFTGTAAFFLIGETLARPPSIQSTVNSTTASASSSSNSTGVTSVRRLFELDPESAVEEVPFEAEVRRLRELYGSSLDWETMNYDALFGEDLCEASDCNAEDQSPTRRLQVATTPAPVTTPALVPATPAAVTTAALVPATPAAVTTAALAATTPPAVTTAALAATTPPAVTTAALAAATPPPLTTTAALPAGVNATTTAAVTTTHILTGALSQAKAIQKQLSQRWDKYGTRKNYEKYNPYYNEHMSLNAAKSWSMGTGIVFAVLSLLLLLMVCCACHQIQMACDVLAVSVKAMEAVPCLMALPLIDFIWKLLVFFTWLIIFLYLVSCGQVTAKAISNPTGTDVHGLRRSFKWTDEQKGFMVFMFFGLLWLLELFTAIMQFTLSYSVVRWYYTKEKKSFQNMGIIWGYIYAMTYHLGTVALGSFLIASCRMIKYLAEMAKEKAKGEGNPVVACAMQILQCCCQCLEECLRKINTFVYVDVAITSQSFCSTFSNIAGFFAGNFAAISVMHAACTIFTFAGVTLISGTTGYLTYYLCTSNDRWSKDSSPNHVNSPRLVGLVAAIMAAFIAYVFMMVFEHVADTLLYTYCWNVKNAHNTANVYAPKELQDLVNHIPKTPPKKEEAKPAEKPGFFASLFGMGGGKAEETAPLIQK